MKEKAFLGNGFYSQDFDHLVCFQDGLLCVDETGVITALLRPEDENYQQEMQRYAKNGGLQILSPQQVLLPGFVDLHIHGPQWAQAGTALDQPLEIWLGQYTFPLEASFQDLDYAKVVYDSVVKTTLRHGTTTGVYFATVDTQASLLLAQLCGTLGQRGLVGKVVMDDQGGNPAFYRDSSSAVAVAETAEFVSEIQGWHYPQGIYPVVTPRFIPSCTDEAMADLGKLAQSGHLHIQTHCSESDWEHGFAKERYGISDAMALHRFGLITDKTILAHAPFLEPADVALLAETGASIAHCPLSNGYFANGVLPLQAFRQKGVSIGLATDISGGYSPSMYSAIRHCALSSRILQDGVNPDLPSAQRGKAQSAVGLNGAFYTATVAGGKALGLPIGKLEAGYACDLQIVDTSRNIPQFGPEKKPEDLLHKILLLSESADIQQVYVQGKLVHSASV